MILGFGFISSVYGAKSGVFIGADVGVNYHVSEGKVIFSSPGNAYTSESNDYLFDLSYGLRGGFQYYFTPKVGLRVVGAFGKGTILKVKLMMVRLMDFLGMRAMWISSINLALVKSIR